MGSNDYIIKLALEMATGQFSTERESELPDYRGFVTTDGEALFEAAGGVHRTAAMRLLGRTHTKADVSFMD